MKADRFPREEVEQLPEHPVDMEPFDPESKQQALAYLKHLNKVLEPIKAEAEFFGSVELEVAGKGEWEYAIWLDDENWYGALTTLINHYKSIWFLGEDISVFSFNHEGNDVEVIPMRGEARKRNQAIMHFWRTNLDKLKEYEQLKFDHAYSKREYYWWKHNYIGDIIETL
jgi:hypothetical protein